MFLDRLGRCIFKTVLALNMLVPSNQNSTGAEHVRYPGTKTVLGQNMFGRPTQEPRTIVLMYPRVNI